MSRKLIIHFKHLASALAKISFCVKKTQPVLKRGKAGYNNKMKSFVFKPMMLAQKQKAELQLFRAEGTCLLISLPFSKDAIKGEIRAERTSLWSRSAY